MNYYKQKINKKIQITLKTKQRGKIKLSTPLCPAIQFLSIQIQYNIQNI